MSDSQSTDGTKPTRVIRRRRKCRACDSCYRKKIQCDQATPKCNWCYHQNIPCTFTRNHERFRGQQLNPASSERSNLPPESPRPEYLRPDPHGSTGKPHNMRLTLGNICTFNGLPFFSSSGREWIKKQTGEDANLTQFLLDRNHSSFTSGPATSISSTYHPYCSLSLPDKTLLYQILNAYTSSVFFHIFPFITPSLFEHTIRAAYHQQLSSISPGAASAKACVMAFLAMSPMFCHFLDPSQLQIMGQLGSETYRSLPEVFSESVTVDGLQALLLLCIHSQAIVGDLFTVNLLTAAATRFVYQLEGNITPVNVDEQSLPLKRHIRNLFWVCYLMDHENSLRSGLPPNFDDTHCDFSLPECYGDLSAPSTCSPLFLPFIRLSIVQSEIYRRLYSVSALRQTDAQLLGTIQDLDELLENWKLSIPIDNRPTFTERPSDAGSMPSSVMQLQYHYCMATIHQASGRCSSWAQNQNTHGPGSSLAISVEASRSLLRKFSESELDFHRRNLMFCLPYITVVMIHLFCNFLLNPLDPRCRADLDVMERLPHQIQAHVWPQAPAPFLTQVDFVKELSTELQRLAHSALRKAMEAQAQT
ncbi:putative C6 transcription factor [Aspergillus steynii IBT 23096]|uniref:Putative C6 transcription factor n=1 Tax=Aspergillus steynii IBT 23096 TaxID=1392250 RepID=A0A2I2G144_9EURO|nr:putative C6 transcription factor [Aspergillus steynii IBT 23096]PLB46588.1 putative C6 transcription factor [Aspergillus steynii IBT 23096]